jgi:hypothetical protein
VVSGGGIVGSDMGGAEWGMRERVNCFLLYRGGNQVWEWLEKDRRRYIEECEWEVWIIVCSLLIYN